MTSWVAPHPGSASAATLPTGGLALAMRRSVASAEKLTATGLAKRATHSTMTVRYEKP
jgi:hypothetical protein